MTEGKTKNRKVWNIKVRKKSAWKKEKKIVCMIKKGGYIYDYLEWLNQRNIARKQKERWSDN